MGQYHCIINLDKRVGYTPRSLGAGVKLAEQAESLTPGAALLLLLSDPNGWGGERIAIVGDYAEDTDLTNAPYPASELWTRVRHSAGMKNVGWLARKVIEEAQVATFTKHTQRLDYLDGGRTTHTYYDYTLHEHADTPEGPAITVYNHDKHQRLTPTLLGDPTDLRGVVREGWNGGTATALTMLLAASCKGGARGGGDYPSEHPLIGSWAGDRISVAADADGPCGYEDITATLREEVMADHVCGAHYLTEEKGRVSRAVAA